MSVTSANRIELLQIAEAVAREKLIEPELVIAAMEDSLAKAARSRYGAEYDIRANIDPKSGELTMERCRTVVEEVENSFTEITLKEALKIKSDAEIDDVLKDSLPPLDFGRIAAQSAKQVIMQRVRDAERARQYEEFKDRVGQIINGLVKRIEYGNVIVDVGRGEAVLRRDQLINRETFRSGDRVRTYIKDVRSEVRGPQIFLSRTQPEFLAELFKMEVPEIYDGIIEIKGVAREPGSRAKIAVLSNDTGIDPVGACVGMRGSRVQAVVGELQGEKVEIIPYVEDPAAFVVNALAPAEVAKVVMDEIAGRMEVVVPDDQLSLAIGRRGQNVRLASQLSGWYIDVLTEAEESERRQEEFKTRSTRFIEALNIDDVIAHLLVAEGYVFPEEIAESTSEELSAIQGFDEDLAGELQNRAVEYVERESNRINAALDEMKVSDDLRAFEYISLAMLLTLAENDIRSLDDLAGLDNEELLEFLGQHGLSDDGEAGDIIMAARAHWFEDEDAAGAAEAKDVADTGDQPAVSDS